MKFNTRVASFAGIFLFLAGILLEMALSGGMVWSEVEARLYATQTNGLDLELECPLALALDEVGTISTLITNSLDEAVTPMVVADFSREGVPQKFSEILTLPPRTSKAMTWNVDASNVIFGRLILVSVLQRTYRRLPARQGYCGILLLDFFGMRGIQILILFCAISVLLLIFGSAIWLRTHSPMAERAGTVTRAFVSLAALATVGLVTALLRWWGVTIILDGIALLLIGVIFTEVLFKSS